MKLSKSIKKVLTCGSALIMIGGISNGVANLAISAPINVSAKARKSRARKPRYRKNSKRRNKRISRKHLRRRASKKRNRKVVRHRAKKNKKVAKHHLMKRHARKQRHDRKTYRARNRKNKRVARHRNKRRSSKKVRKHNKKRDGSNYIPIYGNGSSVAPSSSANVPASSANSSASSSAQSNNDDFSGFNFNFNSGSDSTPVEPSHIDSNANNSKSSASSMNSQSSSNNNASSKASSDSNKPNSQGLLPGEYYEYGYLQPGNEDGTLKNGIIHFTHSFLVRAKNPYANWTSQQFRAEFPHIKQLINDYIIPAYHDEGPAYDTSDSYDAGNPNVVKVFQFMDATPIESQKSYIQNIQGSNAQEAY